MRLMSVVIVLALPVFGLPRLPLEFNSDPGWQARPTFLGNPSDHPEVLPGKGHVTLTVAQPGKGMKFELAVKPFDSAASAYLLLRYKAQRLSGGYALWVYDGGRGGRQILGVGELDQDAEWHVVAIDLWARGVKGAVRTLLTEVQCRGEAASLSFDYLRLSDDVPEGAKVVPKDRPAAVEHVIHAGKLELQAQPDWLSRDALSFEVDTREGVLHLSAAGPQLGMKWSVDLPEPIVLSKYAFAAIRYRARETAAWGDYLMYLGSGPGGMPKDHASPFTLRDVRVTDQWQVAVVPIAHDFTATNIALQVSSSGARGDLWIDTIRFTSRRPLVDIADILAFETGWKGSRLPQGSFSTIDLAPSANGRMHPRLRGLGLASWFPDGNVVVCGIPFHFLGEGKNVLSTEPDIDTTVGIDVGTAGSEVYVLMVSRLPDLPPKHGREARPMSSFASPERFVFRVEYETGTVDDVFPASLSTGKYEVQPGPEVYCLTGLEPHPISRISLANRMPSASFLVAGVTVNQAAAVTLAPAVAGLPAPAPARAEEPGRGRITATAGGYIIENDLLLVDLKTEGGIALRRLDNRCLIGQRLEISPGPLFEIGVEQQRLTSEEVTVGPVSVKTQRARSTLTVGIDGTAGGVPLKGELVIGVGGDAGIDMRLDVIQAGKATLTPEVNFPIIRSARIGAVKDTYYLWARKGGVISNAPIRQRLAYGGEHPLQVTDIFNPAAGGGLALLTRDLDDVYRFRSLTKDDDGITWRVEYWQREYQPGERIETVPTVLRAHTGDWRRALTLYKDWVNSWYKPQVPRKDWFQRVFYYQQTTAWGRLRDQRTGVWRVADEVNTYRSFFGCLDYLHIFDFGQSKIYGRVGDYNHYDELGGLDTMRAALQQAREMGVPIGLYIEGYLCDERGVWGRKNVDRNDIRKKDGTPLLWPGAPPEHMMCPAAEDWRNHLAETYRRVARELKPNGMYIDQYGFINTWKTCWSREHGHPVPWAPIRGERDTTKAIRASVPAEIATLTEETPNDVNSQYQDGGLGYSVSKADPNLAPHRIDLFRFVIPSFKVLQLTQYDAFTEGNWEKLKYPFFNGEGYWLGNSTNGYCEDAHVFLRRAFAALHRYEDAFCSNDVEPLVPTLVPTVYANRFASDKHTVWTLCNARFNTFRGDCLRVPHKPGTRYLDPFTEREIKARIEGSDAIIAVELGPRAVGCVVAERR